jgi:hypothetical protein
MPHGADRRLMLLDRPLAVPNGTDAARGQGIRMITPQGVWWTMGVQSRPYVSGGVDARLATHVSVGKPQAQAA